MGKFGESWQGFMPAVVTPFKEDGSIDEAGFRRNLETFIAEGVHGIVISGDNGEAWALSDEEKLRLFKIGREVVDQSHLPAKVVGGTSATCTSKMVELTRRAADLGIDAAMIQPQSHLPSATDAEVIRHYEAVAKAVDLAIVLYNAPRTTNINLGPALLDQLSDLDNVAAIKDSNRDFAQTTASIETIRGRISYFLGPSTLILPAFMIGARGYIATSPDVLGKTGVDYYYHLVKGEYDQAKAIHFKLCALYGPLMSTGTAPAALKAALDMVGKVGGYPREPVMPLSPAERDKIRQLLVKVGAI